MQGRRVYADDNGRLPPLAEGEFGRDGQGVWFACSPGGLLACLQRHEVEEHPDGTITVSPSVLVRYSDAQWHGYLRRGVWSSC